MNNKSDNQTRAYGMDMKTHDAGWRVADRPVSQDAQEVAREIADRYTVKLGDSKPELVKRIATALQSHADAARPKVSESDEQAVRELVAEWLRADPNLAVQILPNSKSGVDEFIQALAQDRVSVRDAARLAERERIRGAVATMLIPNPTIDLEDAWYNTALGRVMAAIDGQPVGGGGE